METVFNVGQYSMGHIAIPSSAASVPQFVINLPVCRFQLKFTLQMNLTKLLPIRHLLKTSHDTLNTTSDWVKYWNLGDARVMEINDWFKGHHQQPIRGTAECAPGH